MHRKTHVGFGEEGTCFLPEANQERRCALTLPITARHESPITSIWKVKLGFRSVVHFVCSRGQEGGGHRSWPGHSTLAGNQGTAQRDALNLRPGS